MDCGSAFLDELDSPLILSEPKKHNRNPVELGIWDIKRGIRKNRNACGTGPLKYDDGMWEYLCDVNNYVARVSINNRLPYEFF